MTTNEQYRQAAFPMTPPETRTPNIGVPPAVEPFTPRDAAKALIRPYVLRGDPLDDLKRGMMGQAGTDFHAQIGGSIAMDGARKKVRADQIGVSRVGAEPVSAVFSLAALYKEIRAEAEARPETPRTTDADVPVSSDDGPLVDRIDRDPAILPNRRLPHDFWPEFHLEWQFREENGMERVEAHEFAAMRDRSDGVSWPSAGDDDDTLPDAPRPDRFGGKGETVFDARRAKLDATIDVLANKVEQIVTGDGYRAYLKMLSRFHSYSANNIAFIWTSVPRQ